MNSLIYSGIKLQKYLKDPISVEEEIFFLDIEQDMLYSKKMNIKVLNTHSCIFWYKCEFKITVKGN